MENERYETLYIVSYVGEYNLKHSRLLIAVDELEEYSKVLYSFAMSQIRVAFDIDDNYISDVHSISGTIAQLKEYAIENSKYLFELLNQPYGVGADDGHYDYFPDLVDQFKQLCKQTDMNALYNETIDNLKKHHEYNECEEVEFDRL